MTHLTLTHDSALSFVIDCGFVQAATQMQLLFGSCKCLLQRIIVHSNTLTTTTHLPNVLSSLKAILGATYIACIFIYGETSEEGMCEF